MANFLQDYGIKPKMTSDLSDKKPINLFDFSNIKKPSELMAQPTKQVVPTKQEIWPEDVKIFRDLLSKWIEPERARDLILKSKQPKDINDLWLLEESRQRWQLAWESIKGRIWEVTESWQRPTTWNAAQRAIQPLWTALKTAWSAIWAWFDIAGQWIAFITPDIVKNKLSDTWKAIWDKTPEWVKQSAITAIQEWWEAYNQFKKTNPFLADALEWSWNIASLIPIWKWTQAWTKVLKQGWDKLVDTWKVVLQKTWDKIDNTKQSIKATKQQIESWLTKEQIKGFQSNPYQADEFAKLTERIDSPEWLSDIKDYKVERVWAITKELTDEIDKIRATKWETSKLYKEVREQPVEIKVDTLINDFETTLRNNWMDIKDWDIVRIPWSKAKNLNSWDIAKFDTLYKDILADAQKWYLTPDEILTFRKTASDLANYDATTTTTWQWIIKSIRKNIDNTAKEQVPWLKQLDEQFVDKLDEFENAIKDLVYKWWDVKWEWRSNIVNIVWTLDRANRAKLLARLDEVIPWIWERIQAIDNLPTILKSLESKWIFEKYTWFGWAFAWASVWAPIPIVWPIVWAIVWFTWWKLLEWAITWIRKNALNKILNRVSQEWKKRLDEINIKMKNKKLLNENDKQFINTLKQQFKNELTKEELPKTINRSTNTSKSMTSMNSNSNSSTNTTIKNQVKPLMLKAKESKPLPQTTAPKKLVPQIETKLKNLTKDNIDDVAKSFTNDAQKLAKIKVVIREHIKKYGEQFKDYMAELVDKIADTLGTRMKFMWNDWIWVDKTKLLKWSDDLVKYTDEELKIKLRESLPEWWYKNLIDAINNPFRKEIDRRIKLRNKKVTSTSNNLYHTTWKENLDSIIKNWLTTWNKPRFWWVSSSKKISFWANEQTANYYSKSWDIMIRTKTSYIPKDLELDLLAWWEWVYTTWKNILPEMLEVKIWWKWINLKDYKPKLLKKTK